MEQPPRIRGLSAGVRRRIRQRLALPLSGLQIRRQPLPDPLNGPDFPGRSALLLTGDSAGSNVPAGPAQDLREYQSEVEGVWLRFSFDHLPHVDLLQPAARLLVLILPSILALPAALDGGGR